MRLSSERYLLDTNVVSELTKAKPSSAIVNWIDAIDEDRIFLSVLTIGELREGREKLGSRLTDAAKEFYRLKDELATTHPQLRKVKGLYDALVQRTQRISEWYPDLIKRFEGRILDVDRRVCEAWGCMRARLGRPVPAIDSLIAATAEVHELVVVTNDADFLALTPSVLNPWVVSPPR